MEQRTKVDFLYNTIIVLYSLAPAQAFAVPITLTFSSLRRTMTSKSIWDFSSYSGMSCSNSVTFHDPLSKDKAASVRHIKRVLKVLKSVWETSSQHFPAPSLITPGVTSFQQLHDIHVISLPETFKFIPCHNCCFCSSCHFLMTDSSQANFASREVTLHGCMRSRNSSIYRDLDLLFLRDCSATDITLLPWAMNNTPLMNCRMTTLGCVSEGSSP